MTHHEHHRARRWPEGTHMAIGSAVTIAIIMGLVFVVGWSAPPADRQITKPAGRILEK